MENNKSAIAAALAHIVAARPLCPALIVAALALIVGAGPLCPALGFTPVRPLSALKEQDPAAFAARAPDSSLLTMPARYYAGQVKVIDDLTAMTNALWNGQIVLQHQLAALTAAYSDVTGRVERVSASLDASRADYVAKRDASTLPTTKAIYQAFIDIIDDLKAKLIP